MIRRMVVYRLRRASLRASGLRFAGDGFERPQARLQQRDQVGCAEECPRAFAVLDPVAGFLKRATAQPAAIAGGPQDGERHGGDLCSYTLHGSDAVANIPEAKITHPPTWMHFGYNVQENRRFPGERPCNRRVHQRDQNEPLSFVAG